MEREISQEAFDAATDLWRQMAELLDRARQARRLQDKLALHEQVKVLRARRRAILGCC
jgi:hypothetical protein